LIAQLALLEKGKNRGGGKNGKREQAASLAARSTCHSVPIYRCQSENVRENH